MTGAYDRASVGENAELRRIYVETKGFIAPTQTCNIFGGSTIQDIDPTRSGEKGKELDK